MTGLQLFIMTSSWLLMMTSPCSFIITSPCFFMITSSWLFMLTIRRFFPYYISNILAGLDNEGRGVVYSYDPVGHSERTTYRAAGSAVSLLQPLLDNQVRSTVSPSPLPSPLFLRWARRTWRAPTRPPSRWRRP